MSEIKDIKTQTKELILRLKDEKLEEYTKQSGHFENLWSLTDYMIMASGAATPLLIISSTAIGISDGGLKILLAAISVFVTILYGVRRQFRPYERMKLRESGRIYFENLVLDLESRYVMCKNDEDYYILHAVARKAYIKETRSQAIGYFAIHDSDGAAQQGGADGARDV